MEPEFQQWRRTASCRKIKYQMIIKKENIYNLIFSGGTGGNWLAKFLNSHQECVSAADWRLPNNRHLLHFDQEITIGETENNQKVFSCAHLIDPEPNESNLVGLNFAENYKNYYFLLHCLKTLLCKHPNQPVHTMAVKLTDSQQQLFCHAIEKDWHYHHELVNWLDSADIQPYQQVIEFYYHKNLAEPSHQQPCEYSIDLNNLYFDNSQSEYQKICDTFQLTPLQNGLDQIKNYVADNRALAEKYLGCDLESFLSMTNQQALDKLLQACEQQHLANNL